MSFLALIETLIEFSQKEEEFSDEIKAIGFTLTSLQLLVKQSSQYVLPEHINTLMETNLAEAKELLTKVSKTKSSWWTDVKNMLPWSDLNKLKGKNQQLQHIINLLNLHLTSRAKFKRTPTEFTSSELRGINSAAPTKKLRVSTTDSIQRQASSMGASSVRKSVTLMNPVNGVLDLTRKVPKETKEEDKGTGEKAFRLRMLCDEKIAKVVRRFPDMDLTLEKYWNEQGQVIFSFKKADFSCLALETDVSKMSREHAMIMASKSKKEEPKSNMNSTEEKDENKQMESEKQEEKKEEYDFDFRLKDLSLNGTFYLKGYKIAEGSEIGGHIRGDFEHLKKNDEVRLQHEDVIGLVVQKPQCKDLIFGFQFLTH